MAAVVNSVIDRIETLWEAATPPDDTGTTYHRYEGKYDPEGTASDRAFWFEIEGTGVTGQGGTGTTEREWSVEAFLRLTEAGRNMKTMQVAIADEANLLLRAIEKDTFSSVTNAIAVETLGMVAEKEDNGDYILRFSMRVHTQETD